MHGPPDTGIKNPCEFAVSLKSFGGVAFFGLEEMHLFGQGHARLLWSLFEDEHANEQAQGPVFALCQQVLQEVGQAIRSSSGNMPTSFSLSFVGPARNPSSLRAVDWIDILLVIYPTIVAERLESEAARKALLTLVHACSLAVQWKITQNDLQLIDK